MLNKILEFVTHRAVQRCFTWSTILAISVIYLTQEMTIKIENHFYQNLHTVVSISTYFLTIWFNSSIYFSSSHFTFSCIFLIFHPFFDVIVWMQVRCPFQWVNYIAGVRHDWFPWISWLKSTCPNHFQPPQWSSSIMTCESYAFRPFHKKNNKKYQNHRR